MNPSVRNLLLGLPAGAIATQAKAYAESTLQPLSEKAFPPAPAEKTGIGADSAGHPENMPPGELIDRAQHAVTGDELSDEQRLTASNWLHWAMGIGAGLTYALAAPRLPRLRAGHGALAGALLFAGTHGSTLPATGLQVPPWRMPTAWWGWEAGSHLVYGVALDTSLRTLDRLLPG